MSAPLIFMSLPALFVAFGGVLAGKAVSLRRQARAASQWPTAQATILRSSVATMVDEDEKGNETELSSFSVLYRFEVDGHEYRSTRLYLGGTVWSGGSRAAEKSAAAYKTGAVVPVHYNPANPAIAALEPLNFTSSRFAFICAAGFGGLGSLAIALSLAAH